MMPDYPVGKTLDFKFTTRAFATGIPAVLAGSPVIEVYEDNSTTQITAGETLSVDFDSVVGLNNLRIVATGANGYEAGKSYAAIISVGTVGGVSVVGEVVAQFSIERSPVNWANVTAPTTAVDLSGTDIQLVDTCTTNTDMRGTDSAALASVLGALADAAAAGDPTSADTLMQYVKQLINTLEGTAGIPIFPAAADPANNVSLAEVIRAIRDDVTGIAGAAMRGTDGVDTATMRGTDGVDTATMRGTDSAALASVLGTPVGADISADIAAVKADTVIPEKNAAFSNIYVLMVDDTDHVTPKTGLTLTVQRSLDGAAFGAATGSAAEISNGMYQFDATAADMNADTITFRFSGTDADDTFLTIVTR